MEVDSNLFAIISAISTLNYLYPNGWRWIRTTESTANRFTVCPLWPLGNPSILASTSKNYIIIPTAKKQAVFCFSIYFPFTFIYTNCQKRPPHRGKFPVRRSFLYLIFACQPMFSYGQRSKCADLLNSYIPPYSSAKLQSICVLSYRHRPNIPYTSTPLDNSTPLCAGTSSVRYPWSAW